MISSSNESPRTVAVSAALASLPMSRRTSAAVKRCAHQRAPDRDGDDAGDDGDHAEFQVSKLCDRGDGRDLDRATIARLLSVSKIQETICDQGRDLDRPVKLNPASPSTPVHRARSSSRTAHGYRRPCSLSHINGAAVARTSPARPTIPMSPSPAPVVTA
jgi:hypothetical protein